MKKLYISLLSTILCIQQIQSMEKQLTTNTITQDQYCSILRESQSFNTTERFIYVESPRFQLNGFSLIKKQTVDLLSVKLYDTKLNENEIEDLVNQGADVNYKEFLYFDRTVPTFHASNDTEQGIKNMKKLIALGAHLHHTPEQTETPLSIATNHNNTPMILLLLPYEKIETPTYPEQMTRAAIISHSICNDNFEVVEMLLQLKLMTPNKALDDLIYFENPNPKIFDYLIDSGANNYNKHINKVAAKAFSHDNTQILNLLSKHGAYNKDVLTRMYTIKTLVDSTINNLENNSTQ